MSDDTELLAKELFELANPGQNWETLQVGARRPFSAERQVADTHRALARAAVTWVLEHRATGPAPTLQEAVVAAEQAIVDSINADGTSEPSPFFAKVSQADVKAAAQAVLNLMPVNGAGSLPQTRVRPALAVLLTQYAQPILERDGLFDSDETDATITKILDVLDVRVPVADVRAAALLDAAEAFDLDDLASSSHMMADGYPSTFIASNADAKTRVQHWLRARSGQDPTRAPVPEPVPEQVAAAVAAVDRIEKFQYRDDPTGYQKDLDLVRDILAAVGTSEPAQDTQAVLEQVAADIDTARIVCPVHHQSDCSPLLNGCSLPRYLAEQRDRDAAIARERADARG